MRIALINTSKKSKLYPLGLMKISAMFKAQGHETKYFINTLPEAGEFDQIWITTLFTFEIYHSLSIAIEAKKRAKIVKVGGISASLLPDVFKKHGLDVHIGIYPDAERCTPDHSIIGEEPQYSITHTSRGCIRDCGFCAVPKIEPKFFSRDWIDDLNESKKILFYDNNWTAKPYKEKVKDVEKIKELKKSGRIKTIDFNQGLDARLITEKVADLLVGVPIDPVRFAFDGMHEDGHWQRAVKMMIDRGFKQFMTYTLYNFNDTPEDYYFRLRESRNMADEIKGVECKNFPMRYKPIFEIEESKMYIGKHWTKKMLTGWNSIINHCSISGQVSCNSIKEFELWFGKNEKEFVKLLNYSKIKQLCAMKKNKRSMEYYEREKEKNK